jgi:hypothetical protein
MWISLVAHSRVPVWVVFSFAHTHPFAWQADYRYARQESHNIFLAWRPLECQGHEPGTRGVATVRTPRPWGARPDRAVHAEADTRSEIRGKRGAAGQLASAGVLRRRSALLADHKGV